MPKADFVTGLLLMGLSLYVIIEAGRMPRLEHLKVHPLSVPGLVPSFLASVLFVFGAVLTLRSALRGGHRLSISMRGLSQTLKAPENKRLLLTGLLSLIYALLLIGRLPYPLATGLFIFTFILLFEWEPVGNAGRKGRTLFSALAIATLSSIAITLIFERLFLVSLP
ncbi:MAG: tripartite tricarboxylate transporter TctB family protein [Desulfobacterota bacterium]|nr:tripartite tricarboxylate transporter TctB family protein [Thermodesulfobacteriota bacterium]